jgi:hypothetical protein
MPAPPGLREAVLAAREGLLHHNARFAKIVDANNASQLIELIHRDVLP